MIVLARYCSFLQNLLITHSRYGDDPTHWMIELRINSITDRLHEVANNPYYEGDPVHVKRRKTTTLMNTELATILARQKAEHLARIRPFLDKQRKEGIINVDGKR